MFSLMPSRARTNDGDCYKSSVAFATISLAVLETIAFSNILPPAAVVTAAFNHGALVTVVAAHDHSQLQCLLQGSKHHICYSLINPIRLFFKPCVYQCPEMSLSG